MLDGSGTGVPPLEEVDEPPVEPVDVLVVPPVEPVDVLVVPPVEPVEVLVCPPVDPVEPEEPQPELPQPELPQPELPQPELPQPELPQVALAGALTAKAIAATPTRTADFIDFIIYLHSNFENLWRYLSNYLANCMKSGVFRQIEWLTHFAKFGICKVNRH